MREQCSYTSGNLLSALGQVPALGACTRAATIVRPALRVRSCLLIRSGALDSAATRALSDAWCN